MRTFRTKPTGRPLGSGTTPADVRFWAKVERRGFDECWPWIGAVAVSRSGLRRGKFWVPGGWVGQDKPSCQLAPRVAFYLVHRHWPHPLALHGCDNSMCCNAENPEHIHEGTHGDNTREAIERGRAVAPPVRMGIEANRAKLSDAQALEIIERYQPGVVSQQVLADEYRVSQHSISLIVRGQRRSLQ